MIRPAVVRKMLLFGGLAAAVFASVFSVEEGLDEPLAFEPEIARRPLVSVAPTVHGEQDLLDEVTNADPFAQRHWAAPALLPAPAQVITNVVPVAAVEVRETIPPLPFQFVGSMNDGDQQVVYLGRGDQALVVRAGEVVENTYRVVSINVRQIEFEHIPTGQKQILPFPAHDQ